MIISKLGIQIMELREKPGSNTICGRQLKNQPGKSILIKENGRKHKQANLEMRQ